MGRYVTYKKAYFPRRPTVRPPHPLTNSHNFTRRQVIGRLSKCIGLSSHLSSNIKTDLVMERLLYSRQGEPVCYLVDSYITNFILESLSGGVYFLSTQHMGSSEHTAKPIYNSFALKVLILWKTFE